MIPMTTNFDDLRGALFARKSCKALKTFGAAQQQMMRNEDLLWTWTVYEEKLQELWDDRRPLLKAKKGVCIRRLI
jgi:hypothetical protein